jgi:hypothetical protein
MTFSDDRDATGLGLAFVGSFDGSTCTSEVSLDVEAPGTSETVDLPTPRWAVPAGEPRRAPTWECSSIRTPAPLRRRPCTTSPSSATLGASASAARLSRPHEATRVIEPELPSEGSDQEQGDAQALRHGDQGSQRLRFPG